MNIFNIFLKACFYSKEHSLLFSNFQFNFYIFLWKAENVFFLVQFA